MLTISKIEAGSCHVSESLVIKGGRKEILRFPVHIYVFDHPQLGLVLMDGGFDQKVLKKPIYKALLGVQVPEEGHLEQALKTLGYSLQDVAVFILTHFHEDHIGHFEQLRHAKVFVHEVYKKRKELSVFEEIHFFSCENFFPDLGFSGDVIAPGLRLINLEGHAKGMLGLVFDQEKIILASDAGWRLDWMERVKDYTFIAKTIQYNFKQYQKVLKQLQVLMKNGWSVEFNHDGDSQCIQSLKNS